MLQWPVSVPMGVLMFEGLEAALELKEAKASRLSRWQRALLVTAVGAVSAALVAAGQGVVAEPVLVPSGSMVPNIPVGARVVVVDESLFRDSPARGDVVTFASPQNSRQRLVKRIIAVQGEEVGVVDGVVTIDGVRLNEPWLGRGVTTGDFEPVTVPPGHYFVMGDARDASIDSRVFGPISESMVTARAGAIVAPLSEIRFLS